MRRRVRKRCLALRMTQKLQWPQLTIFCGALQSPLVWGWMALHGNSMTVFAAKLQSTPMERVILCVFFHSKRQTQNVIEM